MRTLIIGYGIQGKKRFTLLKEVAGIVDPYFPDADYSTIQDAPIDSFDAAFVCTPDEAKYEIMSYLLRNKKHVLVEKPLVFLADEYKNIQLLSQKAVCYTAYNHRFEPHFVKMKEILDSGVLGKIYSCRMFYGNGTAMDVTNSQWRDKGCGVVHDLGSHLLDTINFLFRSKADSFTLDHCHTFENKAPDHAILCSKGDIFIELEMTLLSWRNSFSCTILAENGSAHIDSLCKWGPATFTLRKRQKPSGRPEEESIVLVKPDPTWEAEHNFFFNLCAQNIGWNNLETDRWIQENLPHSP